MSGLRQRWGEKKPEARRKFICLRYAISHMTKRLYSYTLYTWKQNTPTMMIRRIKSRNKTVFIYEKEREIEEL